MGSHKTKIKPNTVVEGTSDLTSEDLLDSNDTLDSEKLDSLPDNESLTAKVSLASFDKDDELAEGNDVFDDDGLDDEILGELDELGEESAPINPYEIKEELTVYGKVEAILFASPKPMRTVEVHELLFDQGYSIKDIQDALDDLSEFYRNRGGGFHLKYVKRMGYQFQTTSAAKGLMEKQFSSRPRPLSRASLETLSVVAYRQKAQKCGVTRAEVEFIRGVDAGSIFKTLVERDLLTCTGRKEIPGRPMMFGVTDEFLKVFQLGSINDLPPLDSFQTPTDVIDAAQKKIESFLSEQEGVDPNQFMDDPEYASRLKADQESDLELSQANLFQADQATQDAEVFAFVKADAIEKSQLANNDDSLTNNSQYSELSMEPRNIATLAEAELKSAGHELIASELLAASKIAVPLNILDQMTQHLAQSLPVENAPDKGSLSKLSSRVASTSPDASRPEADELL